MGDKTKIEWTDATWNPVRGCTLVSAGCTNCYAMREAHRLNPYRGLTRQTEHGPVWTGEVRLVPELLDQPLRWKKPRRIFVNSMSDLFHEKVPSEFIDKVFAVMSLADWHTYQVLTKRPERMQKYFADPDVWKPISALMDQPTWIRLPCGRGFLRFISELKSWIHLGISVEDQKTFDERWPYLRDTPAAIRFLSYEPALGALDASEAMPTSKEDAHKQGLVDWVIAGAESGPRARPMNEEWVRDIKNRCVVAGVPFFYKQNAINGKKIPTPELDGQRWMQYPK